MLTVAMLLPLLKLLFVVFAAAEPHKSFAFFSQLVTTARFDLMAVGGVLANLGVYKNVKLFNLTITAEMVQTKAIQVFSLTLFFAAVGVSTLPFAVNLFATIAGLCSAVLVFNLALNKRCILQIESAAGNYIGNISYGIYLLHMPVIYLVNQYITPSLMRLPVMAGNLLLYLAVTGLSIACASFSYYF